MSSEKYVYMVRHKATETYVGKGYSKLLGSFKAGRVYTQKNHATQSVVITNDLEIVKFKLVEASMEESKTPVNINQALRDILESKLW